MFALINRKNYCFFMIQNIKKLINYKLLILCLFLLFIHISCSNKILVTKTYKASKKTGKPYKVFNKWYYPLLKADNYSQKGIASWYGKDFHGRKTSNGEIYNMYALTAAHKTLPLGTYVIVYNLENRKKVLVKINDRGPFVSGRIIDLSYAAAKKLDIVRKGTAKVKVSALPENYVKKIKPKQRKKTVSKPQESCYSFQIGAFENIKNAKQMKNKLEKCFTNNIFIQKSLSKDNKKIYRVFFGKCLNQDEIFHFEKQLTKNGFTDAFIKPVKKL